MTDPSLYSSLDVILEYDDGAVVYLNGVELFRANLPTGTIAYSTLASTSLEDTMIVYPINPSALVTGTNVLAVEVHQESATSNDCHFELRMMANQIAGQSVWRKYYYAGGARVAMREGITSTGTTGLSFLLGDHLGSTNVTTNATGQKVSELRYKPWGEVRYSLGTSQTTFRFTGQREEAALDMYYYGARWYDPYLNHFTQPDTIIPDPSNPQSWNRYTYVNNNPINFTDPSGHCIDVQDGLCMRRVSDNSYRVVRGGSVFPNYVEVAIANSILSQDTRYLNIIPNSSSGTIFRSIAAAGSQMGYGNFNTLFDQALDPSIPLVGAGVIGGWVLKPGQSGQSYIQGLEGGNPDAHAWSKHGPYSSDEVLIAAAKRLKSPQARFSDENVMALAIQQTLSTNLSEIISRANAQKSGINPYSGPSVSFSGFQNQQGKIIAISGQASIQVFIWYDGKGNWGLYTAYPKP